ncbi:hypothetical protein QVD17_42073 [Tagetes erecta]|uniref:Uncharacterized protein n=1 Tax=Tagetes erecta TaxID=13708 RepID=A0AAD8JN07_TARER|nr:hypothetical protein QVD17_42073 [Tagetes erecta]
MTGVGAVGVPDSHSGSDSAFISLSPIPEIGPPRYVSIPVGLELADQTRGNWLMEERNGNAELAPTAEDGKKLVDVQENVVPGDVARLIEGLKVNVEPIKVAQNVGWGYIRMRRRLCPKSKKARTENVQEIGGGNDGGKRKTPNDGTKDGECRNGVGGDTTNGDGPGLKEYVKEWERKDDVTSMFENGESSNAQTQVFILGEPVERTLVTLMTRCAQYENQIATLKKKVGVFDKVAEATDERLKSYDEERVMQEHTLFQLNDLIRKLEEEMMETFL